MLGRDARCKQRARRIGLVEANDKKTNQQKIIRNFVNSKDTLDKSILESIVNHELDELNADFNQYVLSTFFVLERLRKAIKGAT
jgi:replicative superfamily II helicase